MLVKEFFFLFSIQELGQLPTVILPQLSLGFTPRQLRIAYLHTQHINNGSSALCAVCENFNKTITERIQRQGHGTLKYQPGGPAKFVRLAKHQMSTLLCIIKKCSLHHQKFRSCTLKIKQPCVHICECTLKTPLEIHCVSKYTGNKEIYYIFKTWCIICFISHNMPFIS